MSPEIIQAAWTTFSKKLPKGENIIIRRERRRCFFAGAKSLMMVLSAMGDSSATEEEGSAVLSLIEKELNFQVTIFGTEDEDRRVF